MPEAPPAFNARVALRRAAQKSLDVQYDLIADDAVGRMFLRELRDAAQRGVACACACGSTTCTPAAWIRCWRILGSLDDFGRVNHRMHNKLFIADNSVAISGGQLSADGQRIEWLEPREDGTTKLHTVEPGDHWAKRLQIWLLQPFVATSLL